MTTNRFKRRQWAKESGLLKRTKYETYAQRIERIAKSIKDGNEIQLRNKESDRQRLEELEIEKEEVRTQAEIKKLIDAGMTPSEALKQVMG
jgi:hypothetical protein